jgi:hypothetical protein
MRDVDRFEIRSGKIKAEEEVQVCSLILRGAGRISGFFFLLSWPRLAVSDQGAEVKGGDIPDRIKDEMREKPPDGGRCLQTALRTHASHGEKVPR